jgi:hypothetical protein
MQKVAPGRIYLIYAGNETQGLPCNKRSKSQPLDFHRETDEQSALHILLCFSDGERTSVIPATLACCGVWIPLTQRDVA